MPYCQDGAAGTAHHFVSDVPWHMRRRLNVGAAPQTQNDEIGFESVGGQQDLVTTIGIPNLTINSGMRWDSPQHLRTAECTSTSQVELAETLLLSLWIFLWRCGSY
jgi:hypothetical protein